MGSKLKSHFKPFLYKVRQEDGASLIEFALIAPIFILFILGIMQLGLILIVDNALEAAVRQASRYGITGQGATTGTRDAAISSLMKQVAQNYSGGIINPNNITFTVKSYASLQDLDANASSTGTFGNGGEAVKYEAQYAWNTLMPIFGASNIIALKASAPVVNEGFGQ